MSNFRLNQVSLFYPGKASPDSFNEADGGTAGHKEPAERFPYERVIKGSASTRLIISFFKWHGDYQHIDRKKGGAEGSFKYRAE